MKCRHSWRAWGVSPMMVLKVRRCKDIMGLAPHARQESFGFSQLLPQIVERVARYGSLSGSSKSSSSLLSAGRIACSSAQWRSSFDLSSVTSTSKPSSGFKPQSSGGPLSGLRCRGLPLRPEGFADCHSELQPAEPGVGGGLNQTTPRAPLAHHHAPVIVAQPPRRSTHRYPSFLDQPIRRWGISCTCSRRSCCEVPGVSGVPVAVLRLQN